MPKHQEEEAHRQVALLALTIEDTTRVLLDLYKQAHRSVAIVASELVLHWTLLVCRAYGMMPEHQHTKQGIEVHAMSDGY